MPVFNGGPELAWAIESLQGQTCRDWELIAINDGSSDDTGNRLERAAAADPRIRVWHQTNVGLGGSLRRAAQYAQAPLLARMDADDISAPTRLERLLEYLARRPNHVLVGTWAWRFAPGFGIVGARKGRDDHSTLLASLRSGQNPFVHGTVMFRHAAYAQGSGYRFPDYCEEFDVWLQLAEQGAIGMVERFEYLYRENIFGMSYSNFFRQPELSRLALRLAQERQEAGRELTDWSAECERVRHSYAKPTSVQQRQIQAYSTAILHLTLRKRCAAALQFVRCLRPNALGARAAARLVYSVLLGLGLPNYPYDATDMKTSPDDNRGLTWTIPWLRRLGLPVQPFGLSF